MAAWSPTATDPWVHDLTGTNRFTELWPLLLVLALLLWPLDIALRRMSLGRRELAGARGWLGGIGRRRRAAGPRTATAEGLLAASGRATGSDARAAMRSPAATPAIEPNAEPAPARPATPTAAAPTPPAAVGPAPSAPPAPQTPIPAPPAPSPTTPPASAGETDTMARLRDAKRRARDR